MYFTNTFMIAYTTPQLELPRSLILECLFFVTIIQFCIQPLAAWIAEKIGATRFLCLVSLLAMASPYQMFVLVSSALAPLIILGIAFAVVCMASFYAVIADYVEIYTRRQWRRKSTLTCSACTMRCSAAGSISRPANCSADSR